WVLLYGGGWRDPVSWLLNFNIPFANLLLYDILAVLTWKFRKNLGISLKMFFVVLIVGGLSMFMLYDTHVTHTVPYYVVVFLFVPIQFVSGIVLILAFMYLVATQGGRPNQWLEQNGNEKKWKARQPITSIKRAFSAICAPSAIKRTSSGD